MYREDKSESYVNKPRISACFWRHIKLCIPRYNPNSWKEEPREGFMLTNILLLKSVWKIMKLFHIILCLCIIHDIITVWQNRQIIHAMYRRESYHHIMFGEQTHSCPAECFICLPVYNSRLTVFPFSSCNFCQHCNTFSSLTSGSPFATPIFVMSLAAAAALRVFGD